MEPITGVVSSNNVAWEFVDNEICPLCDEVYTNLVRKIDTCKCGGKECELCDQWADEIESQECFDHEKLIGDWKKNNDDLWEPDRDGEFAAIVTDSTFNCVQVVWSRWTTNVRAMCSPCFPGQADLDSGEGNIIAYTLPDYLLANQEFIDVEKE